MDFDYQILRLTPLFYQHYPANQYPELLIKTNRAYNCLLIDTHDDYLICVPYRTEMRHKNGYKFRHSNRSKLHQSGLDYQKIVIIRRLDYIEATDAVIDSDEYNETVSSINKIVAGALHYVHQYIEYVSGRMLLNPAQYKRLYQYSTLPYFHTELGLEETE